MKAPAFQFYPKDFLADTASMTAEQVGVYWRLCCYAWVGIPGLEQGHLPADETHLARLAGVSLRRWRSIAAGILICFAEKGENLLCHKRLMEEIKKQKDLRTKRKHGAECRWNAHALQVDCKTDALQSSSTSAREQPPPAQNAREDEEADGWIEDCWKRTKAVYPPHAVEKVNGKRAVMAACRRSELPQDKRFNLPSIRPDGAEDADPLSMTVSGFVASIVAWSLSARWLRGNVKNLWNFIESGQCLDPPPPAARAGEDIRRTAGAHAPTQRGGLFDPLAEEGEAP